ncbi:HET-domain-containing protein, partial [Ophiobolus disseminans]
MLLPLFTHDPLPESTPHIRLLQLVQGDFDQDIICNLSIWPLDTAPSYIAISYTWGDPTPTVNITVNNRRMVGRQNCQYALQQAFNQTRSRQQYLWLDAICIDQNNNWEKGHQVALMGELYKRAAQVFACVG